MQLRSSRLIMTAMTLTLGMTLVALTGQAETTNATLVRKTSISNANLSSVPTVRQPNSSRLSSDRRETIISGKASQRLAAPTAPATKTMTATTAKQTLTLTNVKVTKSTVSGYTVAGTTVQIINGNKEILGTTTADERGRFSVTVSTALTKVPFTLRATRTGYQSASWRYLAKIKVTRVKVGKTTVSGHVAAGAKVKITNSKKKLVGSDVADVDGHFTIQTTQMVNRTPFKLKATRAGYHAGSWQYVAPLRVSRVKVTKHRVSGQTTAGATVSVLNLKKRVLGRVRANRKGHFTVNTIQTINSKPVNVTAQKKSYHPVTWKYTAPLKISRVKVSGRTVTGHTVAGTTLKMFSTKQKVLARARADARGNFRLRASRSLTTRTFNLRGTKNRYRTASWHYAAKKLNVPLIAQRPELPTGCEITAVTMMLRYQGSKVTKLSLTLEMPRSSNPNKGFVGNPYSSYGWTVYPPALMKLVKKHAHSAVNLTGTSVATLKKQINRGHPVTLWVSGVDGFNTHALTMTGYSPTRIYYNDPWTNKKTSMTTASFKKYWRRDGQRALSY